MFLDLCLLIGSLLIIIFTFSRGGIVLWLVVAAIYLGYQASGMRPGKGVVAVGALLLTAGVLLYFVGDIVQGTPIIESETTKARFDQIFTPESFYDTEDNRIVLFREYLRLALAQPFLGYGTGFSVVDTGGLGQGPHNMYLRAWIDQGVLGLVAYLGLLGSSLAVLRLRGFAPGVALLVIVIVASWFSHNIADDKTVLLLLGMALGTSALEGGRAA